MVPDPDCPLLWYCVPVLLSLWQEKQGARFVVNADFTVRSDSSLLLIFREAGVDSIRLSELSQALLAPAVLPRSQFSMEVCLGCTVPGFTLPTVAHQWSASGGDNT